MKNLKKNIRKILNHSLLVGMVSIFCPSVIQIESLKYEPKNDADNLASDWEKVGSYIQSSYDACTKESRRR
ncbi:MAG: hypothetical protein J1E95_10395 [Muribaculaceae bacterium]|nr:hypothetical protein [Muribaculaceae bacterium]